MQILVSKTAKNNRSVADAGFTLVEVIIAAGIMVILCVGTLTVFSHATKINTGNNLRAQAQSVLQLEAEYYRSLKFIPVGSDVGLDGGTYTNVRTRTSSNGQTFNITVTIDNNPSTTAVDTGSEPTCKFKQIAITAVPTAAESTRPAWLSNANLNTTLVIQRVRAN